MPPVDWEKILENYPPEAIIAMRERQFESNLRRQKMGRARNGEATHLEIAFKDEWDWHATVSPRAIDLIYVKQVLAELAKICGAFRGGEHPQKKERMAKFFDLCEDGGDIHKFNVNSPLASPADRMFLSRTRAKLRAWAKERGDL